MSLEKLDHKQLKLLPVCFIYYSSHILKFWVSYMVYDDKHLDNDYFRFWAIKVLVLIAICVGAFFIPRGEFGIGMCIVPNIHGITETVIYGKEALQ